MLKKKNNQKGFTIIETLVALSIFAFSILGLLIVTSQGAADTNFSKNKLAASYLAQEGIEMIRNMRDSSMLSGSAWGDAFHQDAVYRLSECYIVPGQIAGCDIDSPTLAIDQCPAASGFCSNMRYESATGFFRLGSVDQSLPDSGFNRLITLRDIGSSAVEVTATVYWKQGNDVKNVSLTEDLMDWISLSPPATPPTPSPSPSPTSSQTSTTSTTGSQ